MFDSVFLLCVKVNIDRILIAYNEYLSYDLIQY